MINSPVTNSPDVVLVEEINSDLVVELYRRDYNIDVSKYFVNTHSIKVYKCLETGYRFYYPFNLCGRSDLYEQLEELPWYYGVQKWEHRLAETYIRKGDNLLEIGCGQGHFIENLQRRGVNCVGLEFNEKAGQSAKKKGLNVLNEPINEHAFNNKHRYDVICFFQVLEHITFVREFIEDVLLCLKPSGTLIIGVPNNNPYLFKYDKHHTLNLPPHHMGLWDKHSLTSLQANFDVSVKGVFVERLQQDNFEAYSNLYLDHISTKSKFAATIDGKLTRSLALRLTRLLGRFIRGRNLLAVYTKNP